jgi:hypothetical protein
LNFRTLKPPSDQNSWRLGRAGKGKGTFFGRRAVLNFKEPQLLSCLRCVFPFLGKRRFAWLQLQCVWVGVIGVGRAGLVAHTTRSVQVQVLTY